MPTDPGCDLSVLLCDFGAAPKQRDALVPLPPLLPEGDREVLHLGPMHFARHPAGHWYLLVPSK